jgi:guanylate kinase
MLDETIKKLVASYRPGQKAIDLVSHAKLLLLVGISGAGKDTLKERLLELDEFYNFVSYTTRAPRTNHGVLEEDGVAYHFITKQTALAMLERGEYIEAKEYAANVYGTSVDDLRLSIDSGKVAVNDIEVQGVDEYKRISGDVKAVFVLPPSYEEWQRRWAKRYEGGATNPDDIELRHATAKEELKLAIEKGYYEFVINDDLDASVNRVRELANGIRNDDEHRRGIECAKSLLEQISTH